MSKWDEFMAKIGSTENHYCGKCRDVKMHIWKREKSGNGITGWNYRFLLKCRTCGYEDEIYQESS
jgi:hypothetical protein